MRIPAFLTVLVTVGALLVAAGAPEGPDVRSRSVSTAATLAAAGTACADALVVAVPGNTEGPTSAAPASAGPTLDTFVGAYRAALGTGRTLQVRVVDGATAPARTLARRGSGSRRAGRVVAAWRVESWQGTPSRRARRTAGAILGAAQRCPEQQLLLAGYSQGAMAVHRALLRLAARGDVLSRMVGVVLVGDADRRSGSAAQHLLGGPAAPRAGQGLVPRYLRAVGDVPPGRSAVQVWQVCSRGDVACDIRGVRFADAVARHRGYTSGAAGDRLAAVARSIGRTTLRWAVPDPVSSTVTAKVSQALDRQLGVRVYAPERADVRWGDVAGLPPGVSLTETGRLVGTPTLQGSYAVRFTVRNTADPGVEHRTPGRLLIQVAAGDPLDVSAGGAQSCDVRHDGRLWCWGANGYGQLGDGTTRSRRYPAPAGSIDNWVSVSTSGSTTCGVRSAGGLFCWGLNQWGQLGDGTRTKRLRPTRVADTGPWASVSTGWFHTCGVKTDGSAWCWGYNDAGQLGDGTRTRRLTPVRVAGGGTWREISVGGFHTCGVKRDGTAWCWGRNMFGELATSGYLSQLTPRRLDDASDWLSVEASWNHTCGLRGGGAAFCWGKNDRGQRGDGTRRTTAAMVPVAGGRRYLSLSVGDTHTCAVDTTGQLWCWGDNRYGQLGAGGPAQSLVPVAAGGDLRWRSFDAGWLHGCGLVADGSTRCWGSNADGQVGDGTSTDRTSPAELYAGDPA